MNRMACFRIFLMFPIAFVACDSQEETALTEKLEYLDRQIGIYEERVQKAEDKLEAEKEKLTAATERAQPALASVEAREALLAQTRELIAGLADLEKSMFEKTGLIEAYKSVFRPKVIPPQTNLGDVTLVDGTSYKSVVVRESSPDQMSVVHSGGFSQVPVALLPPPLKSQFVAAPVETNVAPDPREVISRKPASIKSDAEHAAERARIYEDEEKSRKEMAEKRDAEREEIQRKRAEAIKAEDEFRSQWDSYNREIVAIDQQIQAVERQILGLRRQKADMEYANQTGSVRLAQADFLKKVRPIDDQINALNGQITALNVKKGALKVPAR